jgi:nucleoside 2-deoxyribosyltransferase
MQESLRLVLLGFQSLLLVGEYLVGDEALVGELDEAGLVLLERLDRAAVALDPSPATRPQRPTLYLAGPFTDTSVEDDPERDERLFPVPQLVIPADSKWRLTLERTARALVAEGFHVCLPHRDVSRWGAGASSPRTVTDACLRAVAECDVVLAILGHSFGAHVEVGAAVGLGKPVVVVTAANDPPSFVGGGISAAGFAAEIALASLDELPHVVRSPGFRRAVVDAAQARRLSR